MESVQKVRKLWQSATADVGESTSADVGNSVDVSSIPGLGRSPGVGNGHPFQ